MVPTTLNSLPTEGELKSYQIIASIASSNPYWRKLGGAGKPEEIVSTILSVMLLARELGFSPMQSISGGINNIQGRFEISARLMNQAIRSRGHKVQVRTLSDEICVIWGQRKDTLEEMQVSYHIQEAIRSGLVRDGGGWKKNPQDMLFARAISRLARRLYPDCIGGCYVEGELQETIQGKMVDKIEVPSKDEIEISPIKIEPEIELSLPDCISKERVDMYTKEICTTMNMSSNDLKKRASSNLEKFLDAFRKWEEKNFPKEIKEDCEEINF